MPNKMPNWLLLGVGAIAAYVVWDRLRNPLGIAPPVTNELLPATVKGTNAATDSTVPESRTPAAEAAGVLDQDPTAPVWIPVSDYPEGGYWTLAGDLAGDLLRFNRTGQQLEAPPRTPDLSAVDQPRRDEFVTADDALVAPQRDWEVQQAREVAVGLGAGVAL